MGLVALPSHRPVLDVEEDGEQEQGEEVKDDLACERMPEQLTIVTGSRGACRRLQLVGF